MTQIDWSKAPEGTTHANIDDSISIWRRVCGSRVSLIANNQWFDFGENDSLLKRLIPKPIELTGSVLPPIGTVCEAMVSPGEWAKVEVLAHGIEDDDEVAVLQAGPRIITKTFMGIRPIRTPEQIAAEDRLASAYAMCGIAKSLTNVDAALLYDAGLRFEVKP